VILFVGAEVTIKERAWREFCAKNDYVGMANPGVQRIYAMPSHPPFHDHVQLTFPLWWFHENDVELAGAKVTERYTAAGIRTLVEADLTRLFAPWAVGRPEGWVPDPSTRSLVALGYWLSEELAKVCKSEDDRRTQLWKFNRHSRTYDIWETAAECMNDVLDDNVEQKRRGHRRWG
jgi:hypothetical protein